MGTPTRVVLLRNMVGPGQVDEDLEDEVANECSKYGQVLSVMIFEVTTPGYPDDQAVRIFVEFERMEQATKVGCHDAWSGCPADSTLYMAWPIDYQYLLNMLVSAFCTTGRAPLPISPRSMGTAAVNNNGLLPHVRLEGMSRKDQLPLHVSLDQLFPSMPCLSQCAFIWIGAALGLDCPERVCTERVPVLCLLCSQSLTWVADSLEAAPLLQHSLTRIALTSRIWRQKQENLTKPLHLILLMLQVPIEMQVSK